VKARRWKKGALFGLLLLIALTVADYWIYPNLPIKGESHNRNRNGIWLRYTWYFGEATDYDRLAGQFRVGGIRYAYFHVRFIDRKGPLHFRLPLEARRLNQEVGRRSPDVLRIAWIYVGNPKGGGNVDIGDPSIRKKMVSEAKWLIDECGFQGIQWDYEICPDRDPHFLSLLAETRQALPGVHLSAAVPTMYGWPLKGFSWSPEYVTQVAEHLDQFAVMSYDTGMYLPRMYAGHVRGNIEEFGKAAGEKSVMIGVPTYGPGFLSHNPRAESLKVALMAARTVEWPANVEGIAPFADYTMDASEWELFRKYWTGR
jgi:hypothetical protein